MFAYILTRLIFILISSTAINFMRLLGFFISLPFADMPSSLIKKKALGRKREIVGSSSKLMSERANDYLGKNRSKMSASLCLWLI